MKILTIALMIEVLVLFSLLMLHLETIKDELLAALKDKHMANALYGKFTHGLRYGEPGFDAASAGRLPDLDAMAQAKMKAHTQGDDST